MTNLLPNNHKLSKHWLYLGVFALALSGFFAVFLVIGRSPYIYKIIPHKDFFRSVLTIHVNLSILVWLLTCYASIVSLALKRFFFVNRVGLVISLAATIILALSIFDFDSVAFTNNYVPFTSSRIFAFSIYLFFVGMMLVITSSLLGSNMRSNAFTVSVCASVILILSIISFEKTLVELGSEKLRLIYNDADFYELLFWGCGHILMFVYTGLLIYAWFTIAKLVATNGGYISKLRLDHSHNYCQILNMICAFVGFPIVFMNDPSTFEYKYLYTKHMMYFGGIAPSLAMIFVAYEFVKTIKNKFIFADKIIAYNFFWSYVLFASGGIIAFLIEGSNTRIPAHYHGSIIGVSMALMGLTFLYLKTFNYHHFTGKAAKWQPHLYGAGQLIHIIGLAISGGYGMLRKTPGMSDNLEGKAYMGLMGFGGTLAIIGGLCFVIAVINIVRKKSPKKN